MSGILARWTTPSITFKPSQVTVDQIAEIYITLSQRGTPKLVKGLNDAELTEDGFIWRFSQEDTGILAKNVTVEIQIDYLTHTEQRYTTMPVTYQAMNSAVDEVIE